MQEVIASKRTILSRSVKDVYCIGRPWRALQALVSPTQFSFYGAAVELVNVLPCGFFIGAADVRITSFSWCVPVRLSMNGDATRYAMVSVAGLHADTGVPVRPRVF